MTDAKRVPHSRHPARVCARETHQQWLFVSFVGGWLLGLLGADGSFWSQWYGQIVCAVIGAVVLLWIWNKVKKLFK